MRGTKIQWATATWNPITGCTPVSRGCDNCYAKRQAERNRAMHSQKYQDGFELRVHPGCFDEPLRWQKPERIFVCSMSDLFHEGVKDHIIRSLFDRMNQASHHTFMVLTKRPERLADLDHTVWGPNIWAGVTVESAEYLHRIDTLSVIPAAVRFVSFEPLLGPMPDDLEAWLSCFDRTLAVNWAIVGGESGPRARPIHYQWVLDIRDVCQTLGIPFFFKQWGGKNKAKNGNLLQGRTWEELPA